MTSEKRKEERAEELQQTKTNEGTYTTDDSAEQLGDSAIVLFVGKRRFGKTHLMKTMIEHTVRKLREQGEVTTFFIFNALHVNGQFSDMPGDLSVEYKSIALFDEHAPRLWTARPIQIWSIPDREAFFDRAQRLSGCVLVIDEIDATRLFPESNRKNPVLVEVVERGAHMPGSHGNTISIMGATRRLQKVGNDLIAGVRTWCLTRSTRSVDAERIAKEVGEDVESNLHMLSKLDRGEFLRYDEGEPIEEGDDPLLLDFFERRPLFPQKQELEDASQDGIETESDEDL